MHLLLQVKVRIGNNYRDVGEQGHYGGIVPCQFTRRAMEQRCLYEYHR